MINDVFDEDQMPLTEDDRARILSRIHSLLYWLGKFIPEEELLEGQKVKLRDVIYAYVTKPNPTPEEVEGALSLADALDKKARALEDDLRVKKFSKGQAHVLLDEICGLLRAVEEIRKAKGQEAQVRAIALMSKVKDERRWLEFVKQIS
ncbi:MAG: DUF5788 family protein [Methanomassiliicoccales archaeon]|nr:DUF5788 family protein [Methanomassiliicoccales archaeon]